MIDKVLKDYFETDDYENRCNEYVVKHQKLMESDFFDKQMDNFSYAGNVDLERNKMILSNLNSLLRKKNNIKRVARKTVTLYKVIISTVCLCDR